MRRGKGIICTIGILICVATMGLQCGGIEIDLPGAIQVSLNTVTVELVNTTAYEVEPRLFIDSDEHDILPSLAVEEENRVHIIPPLEPGEVLTLTYSCGDAGTIVSDYANLLIDDYAFEADNDPAVVQDEDFECGDTVSLIFIDEVGGDFYTRIEVNGEYAAD